MAAIKKQTVSSTEKLLKIIRQDSGEPSASNAAASSPQGQATLPSSFPKFKTRDGASIGVELSLNEIRLVKAQASGGKYKILGLKSFPVNPDLDQESLEYASILRNALSSIGAKPGAENIWSAAQSQHSELRHLLIPKVSLQQLDNVVYWTAKKEMSFDESKVIFDYMLQGEILDKGEAKFSILAYTVPKSDVERYTSLFARVGYPLSGLSLPPFANQNIFKSGWLKPGEENVAILYIGRDWSRIEIFNDSNLILLRGIKAGVMSMEETLLDGMKDKAKKDRERQLASVPANPQPAALQRDLDEPVLLLDDSLPDSGPIFELELDPSPALSPQNASPAQSAPAPQPAAAKNMDIDDARKTLYSLIPGLPRLEESDPGYGLSPDEIIDMSMPALERLLRQIEMTFKHYSAALGRGNIGKLYVIGLMGGNRPLVRHLNDQLGMECEPLDPIAKRKETNPSEAALLPQPEIAGTVYCQSTGLALSDNSRTPNLLYTFLDKAKQRQDQKVVRLLVTGFAVAFLLLLGVIGWQQLKIIDNSGEIVQLKLQKSQLGVSTDVNLLTILNTKAVLRQKTLKSFAERNLGLAALGAVCELTPENIKLIGLTLDLGRPGQAVKAQTAPAPGKEVIASKTLVIDGVVRGEPQLFEAGLASYVLKLRNCRFFDDPAVTSKNLEVLPDGSEALHFLITITIS